MAEVRASMTLFTACFMAPSSKNLMAEGALCALLDLGTATDTDIALGDGLEFTVHSDALPRPARGAAPLIESMDQVVSDGKGNAKLRAGLNGAKEEWGRRIK